MFSVYIRLKKIIKTKLNISVDNLIQWCQTQTEIPINVLHCFSHLNPVLDHFDRISSMWSLILQVVYFMSLKTNDSLNVHWKKSWQKKHI